MSIRELQAGVEAVVQRFAEIAPAGWARLLGNWEATLDSDGTVTLNDLKTAVVNGGDRWVYGQLSYDEQLYDLVVALNDAAARHHPEGRWTVLDLQVEADRAFTVDVGYGLAKRSNGIKDRESTGRFENYLETWVAEHGRVPGAGPDVAEPKTAAGPGVARELELTPEQRAAWAEITELYRAAALHGWLRIVGRCEATLDENGSAEAGYSTHVAIGLEDDRLVTTSIEGPRSAKWQLQDFQDDITRAAHLRASTLNFHVDMDGGEHLVATEGALVLDLEGTHDPAEDTERHRAELAARLPARDSPSGIRRWLRRR